jgi:Nucleotide modification associated domain 3
MQIVFLRVGIDTGSGGIHGPLFADGRFEFIPIPDGSGIDPRTYGNTLGRYGRPFVDHFPPGRRKEMAGCSMHVDPEFETFTYGDPTPPKRGLRKLEPGDFLIFYAGLKGWDLEREPALYIVGFFEVACAGLASDLPLGELERLFAANFHVRHPGVFADQRERLVLVKGTPASRLLEKAVLLSETGVGATGRPLKVISRPMREVFGDFSGKVSFQRSPPRWVAAEYIVPAARFVRSLV